MLSQSPVDSHEEKAIIVVESKKQAFYDSFSVYARREAGIAFELFYWKFNKVKGSVGHLALKIPDSTDKIFQHQYVSYWPKEPATIFNCFTRDGKLHLYCQDVAAYEEDRIQPEKIDLECLELDTEKMIHKFFEMFPRGRVDQGQKWSLCKDKLYSNCSELTKDLLVSGGINQYFPYDLQFGTYKHLALLSSLRLSTPIAFLACGIYEVNDDLIKNSTMNLMRVLGMVIGNIVVVSYFERKNFKRPYSEMSLTQDSIIGIVGSLGYGAVALLNIWLERTKTTPVFILDSVALKTLWDAIFLLPGTFMGLVLAGKLANRLINVISCCQCIKGASYTCSPINLSNWVKHAIDLRNREQDITKIRRRIKLVNRKEISSMSILYTGWIFSFLVRKSYFLVPSLRDYFEKGMPAIFVGIPLGVGATYLLTNMYEKKIDKENKNDREAGAIYDVWYRSKRFSFVTAATLLGIIFFICVIDAFENQSDAQNSNKLHHFLMGLMSAIGGLWGFFMGDYLYNSLSKHEKNRSMTIQQTTELLSSPKTGFASPEASTSKSPLPLQQNLSGRSSTVTATTKMLLTPPTPVKKTDKPILTISSERTQAIDRAAASPVLGIIIPATASRQMTHAGLLFSPDEKAVSREHVVEQSGRQLPVRRERRDICILM